MYVYISGFRYRSSVFMKYKCLRHSHLKNKIHKYVCINLLILTIMKVNNKQIPR